MGIPAEKAVSVDAMGNPQSIQHFTPLVEKVDTLKQDV
jgi:hypothetical protein